MNITGLKRKFGYLTLERVFGIVDSRNSRLLIRVVVLPPVVFLLESKNIPNLAVTQRRLPLIHLPRNRRIRRILLQELLCRERSSDGIVRCIEDLEAQSILLYA